MRGLPAEDLGRHRAQLKNLEADGTQPSTLISMFFFSAHGIWAIYNVPEVTPNGGLVKVSAQHLPVVNRSD